MKARPCRLALHYGWPGVADHIDLFYWDDDAVALSSYRLPAEFQRALAPLSVTERRRLRLRVGEPGEGAWRALVGAPHRSVYWEYQGPVAGDRGWLAELARGILSGEARPEPWIYLESNA